MRDTINVPPMPQIPNPMKEFRQFAEVHVHSQGVLRDKLDRLIALQEQQNELLTQLLQRFPAQG